MLQPEVLNVLAMILQENMGNRITLSLISGIINTLHDKIVDLDKQKEKQE